MARAAPTIAATSREQYRLPRPGRAFDRTGTLDDLRDGYRLMNDREVLKFQIAL